MLFLSWSGKCSEILLLLLWSLMQTTTMTTTILARMPQPQHLVRKGELPKTIFLREW